LARLEQLRQSLGHASVLARGFALVRDEENRLVRAAAAVAAGQRLRLQFADGEIAAKALEGKEPLEGEAPLGREEPPRSLAPPPEKPRPAPARKRKNGNQGSLF
jgi:exodeoxyribonuclease VII large subunit